MSEQNTNSCSPENCASCPSADGCQNKPVDLKVPANEYTHVKKVIGVVSGKGGVGKSMVTASLARLMKEQFDRLGVPAWVDLWGEDVAHDWPWWLIQFPYYVNKLLER